MERQKVIIFNLEVIPQFNKIFDNSGKWITADVPHVYYKHNGVFSQGEAIVEVKIDECIPYTTTFAEITKKYDIQLAVDWRVVIWEELNIPVLKLKHLI
jgi:hypothetical protein